MMRDGNDASLMANLLVCSNADGVPNTPSKQPKRIDRGNKHATNPLISQP